jgi:hypothetical protein
MINIVMMYCYKQANQFLTFHTQVTIKVIGLRLYPWVVFTPDMRAWFGLNPPMGKGETMRETSQLGGGKVIYRCPRTTRG